MTVKQARQPTESRQAEIVATLVQLAAERSAMEITTTDIAKAMNVSQGALFRHFPNKEAIRVAVVEWIDASLTERLAQARSKSATPLDALRNMFLAHIGFFIEFPGAPRFVFGELQQPSETPVKQRVCLLMRNYREVLLGVIDEARSAGQIRQDIDRQATTALFLGAIQGLVIQSMAAGGMPRLKQQASAVFDLLYAGWAVPS